MKVTRGVAGVLVQELIDQDLIYEGATGEAPAAPVFIDGKKAATLRGPTLSADFKQMVIDYIERRFGTGQRTAAE